MINLKEQPDIQSSNHTGTDDARLQLANHWNIAKDALAAFDEMFKELYWNNNFGAKDRMYYCLENVKSGLHNLGQTIVKIEGYEYDYDSVPGNNYDYATKSIYSRKEKEMKLTKPTIL